MISYDVVTAMKLIELIDLELVDHNRLASWCDVATNQFAEPPLWTLELSFVKDKEEVKKVIIESIPDDERLLCDHKMLADFHVAGLFHLFERNEITWPEFLLAAGNYSDDNNLVRIEKDFFDDLLNKYKKIEVENLLDILRERQKKDVKKMFSDSILELNHYIEHFGSI